MECGVWGSPYEVRCQWLHRLLNTRHPRSFFIIAQNISWTWRICIRHTPTKNPHLFEAAMAHFLFQKGNAFQVHITQETWTSAGQQQTKIICSWIKPWICHLVESIAHSLECRTQLTTALCSFQEWIWYADTMKGSSGHYSTLDYKRVPLMPRLWVDECFENCGSILNDFYLFSHPCIYFTKMNSSFIL